MWASTGRDSRTPEFRNLKAFRTVVSLFVDLVKCCTFSANFEEGPFGRGLGSSRSEDSQSPTCQRSHLPEAPPARGCSTVGMRNVQQSACLPTCRMFNSWHVSDCRMWERSPTARNHRKNNETQCCSRSRGPS